MLLALWPDGNSPLNLQIFRDTCSTQVHDCWDGYCDPFLRVFVGVDQESTQNFIPTQKLISFFLPTFDIQRINIFQQFIK